MTYSDVDVEGFTCDLEVRFFFNSSALRFAMASCHLRTLAALGWPGSSSSTKP